MVSGGGRTIVVSDALLAQAEGLVRLSAELTSLRGDMTVLHARMAPGWLRTVDAPLSAVAARERSLASLEALVRAEQTCDTVTGALYGAMARYGEIEVATERMARQLAGRLGAALGFFTPMLLLAALPALSAAVGGIFWGTLLTGRHPANLGRDINSWLRENNEWLSDPTTVALVRSIVGSSDDFLGGALRFPPDLIAALGEDGIGLTGSSTAAALVVLLASRVGLLGETPVSAMRVSSGATTPARSLDDRASRIPRPGEQSAGEQIRIDRYVQPGEADRFEVYIAGTVDFGLVATSEPWDMTSNVSGVARLPPGSYRAVREAMAEAGITARNPVVLTGYSQGGLVATLVAASGDFNVHGLVTFGAPAGQIEVPEELPLLTVRHSEDLVPATGGWDANRQALVVERSLYAGGDIPLGVALPAHQLDSYRETAHLIDGAESGAVRTRLADLARFGAGAASVETTTWVARRTAPGEPGRPSGGGR